MDIRPTEKPATPGIFEWVVPGGRLALFRRFIRWFNLTVLQAIRPLMIVLFSAGGHRSAGGGCWARTSRDE